MTSGKSNLDRRVLVVDDEPDVRELLTYNLTAAGFTVESAETGTAGLEAVQRFAPDVILLDLMLPDMPGTEVCRRIRGDGTSRQPAVVMLTAKGDEIDRVVGFELGADDYVVKPFSMRELVLRVGAILRGRHPAAAGASRPVGGRRRYVVGPLDLDVETHHAFVNGQEVRVSTLEMRLLAHLIEHRGRVWSRQQLLDTVWGCRTGVGARTIDAHVRRLRIKLGNAGSVLQTIRGTGYRLSPEYPIIIKDQG